MSDTSDDNHKHLYGIIFASIITISSLSYVIYIHESNKNEVIEDTIKPTLDDDTYENQIRKGIMKLTNFQINILIIAIIITFLLTIYYIYGLQTHDVLRIRKSAYIQTRILLSSINSLGLASMFIVSGAITPGYDFTPTAYVLAFILLSPFIMSMPWLTHSILKGPNTHEKILEKIIKELNKEKGDVTKKTKENINKWIKQYYEHWIKHEKLEDDTIDDFKVSAKKQWFGNTFTYWAHNAGITSEANSQITETIKRYK